MLSTHGCPQIAEQLRRRRAWFSSVIDPCHFEFATPVHTDEHLNINNTCTPELLMQLGNLSNVGQVAAGIVHEIRNPLASLKGFLQMLCLEWQGGESGREYIKIMLEEIEGINGIAGELLSLARPSQPQRDACNLGTLTGEVIGLLKGQARMQDIDLDYSVVPVNLPTTMVDGKKIKQVILNLACNAVQAMPQGGLINISVTYLKAADGYVIEVKDNGPGMGEEVLAHIFTPFFSTKGQGGGLGLHIVQGIINEHQGTIKVSSKPGQGTTFKIWLPRLNSPDGNPNH